ncbi:MULTISPECIES: hypothetical protein [unclassified Streptomyces]|uniref:DUF7739 domain-containing protein n=1 Tax=unclassified Streptomyces TaxID=2593676 RepID=UPI0023655BBE|nr:MULTISPECIES: hypothetical protein [unclassified Streptomyces]MDF3141053.1 hypothetical protein [Streptomyces sp. T21Q-yed]WDF45038.1 hypothetical protein PBV52_50970 [Streptomyces sp. T12]
MTWAISHGTREGGQFSCAYSSMATLAQHLAHVLSAAEWRSIRRLFCRPPGAPIRVHPVDASRIADLLFKASNHKLMPDVWAVMAYDLAMTAGRAAGSREPWTWT